MMSTEQSFASQTSFTYVKPSIRPSYLLCFVAMNFNVKIKNNCNKMQEGTEDIRNEM